MRGIIYHNRVRRLLVLATGLMAFYFFHLCGTRWLKIFVEDKIAEVLGHGLSVRIGDISGGVFGDIVLQDVGFFAGKNDRVALSLERVEMAYRLWEATRKDPAPDSGKTNLPKRIAVYFGAKSPFTRGLIELKGNPETLEVAGYVRPFFSGENLDVSGAVNMLTRAVELELVPMRGNKSSVKFSGSQDAEGKIQIYARLNRTDIGGREVIGDLKAFYESPHGVPRQSGFSVSFENLIVDKRPFWDFAAEGAFFPDEGKISFQSLRWGDSFELNGNIGTNAPYQTKVKILTKGMELKALTGVLGDDKAPFFGAVNAEIYIEGPAATANVKGRLYIGEGALENMEFRSMFATLEGTLPIVRVVDSRVVKKGGYILVTGEMDFSKWSENKAFDGLVFDTDNKVAVWKNWQIAKEDGTHLVEATRDRVILTTSVDDKDLREKPGLANPVQQELGFSYKLDNNSSVKLEFDDERDFLGLEHKWQF
ncbi:MAG: hypothetical protein ABIH74_04180 [Candidatus Omnitrophota bacterium]